MSVASVIGKVSAVGFLLVLAVMTYRASTVVSSQPQGVAPVTMAWPKATLASHLADAVTFQTVTYQAGDTPDAGQLQALHRHLEKTYPLLHASLKREVIHEGALLYTWEGTDASLPPAMVCGHLDVVPVPEDTLDKWDEAPFGTITSEYVYGRGTLDNKGNILAQMEAVERLLSEGFQPTRTVFLAYGHDEEVNGMNGAAHIAKAVKAKIGEEKLFFISDEGTMVLHGVLKLVEKPVALVGVSEKGIMDVQMHVTGTPGHASVPPAHTAVGVLAQAVTELENNQMPSQLGPLARAMLDTLCPEVSFGLRLLICNLDFTDWLVRPFLLLKQTTATMVRTTTAVTMIEGGAKSNVLPGHAQASVNHRLASFDSVQGVVAHYHDVLSDPAVEVVVMPGAREPSPVSSTDTAAYATVARTIAEVFPDAVVVPGAMTGATDTFHYWELTDNIFRFSPFRMTHEDIARLHGLNERISIDGICDAATYYHRLLTNALGAPLPSSSS